MRASRKNVMKGCKYVKVAVDGAPYLRKVDLKNYSAYPELSSALEKMFSCFTIGKKVISYAWAHLALKKNS